LSALPDHPANLSISVVVPTHNRRDGLPRLLDALASSDADEIVVVVNASQDGSLELLQERAASDPTLKPLYFEQPGAARARQFGVEQASSDVVLLLDDDVIPEPGLAAGHRRHHEARKGLFVLGYMPVALPRRRQRNQYPLYLYSLTYEQVCSGWEADPGSILKAVWGGNLSLRRDDCLAVGIVPEKMPPNYSYHEDLDFGLRCRAYGLEGAFDRNLLATHQYERTPEAYFATALGAGQMRASIHAEHGEEVGALPIDFYEHGTPVPGKWLIRCSRRPQLYGPIVGFLRSVLSASGAVHAWAVESHAAHLLATVVQQRHTFDPEAAAPGAADGGPAGRGYVASRLGLDDAELRQLRASARARVGRHGLRARELAFALATAPGLRRLIPPAMRRRAIDPLLFALMPGQAEILLYAGQAGNGDDA
jgi:hypothetical protein